MPAILIAPIKEDLNVDLEVVSRELTDQETESLKEFLRKNRMALPRMNVRATRAALRRKLKSGK